MISVIILLAYVAAVAHTAATGRDELFMLLAGIGIGFGLGGGERYLPGMGERGDRP